MFEYAGVFVNILLTQVSAVCIKLYPQRKHIPMGILRAIIVHLAMVALQFAGYLFVRGRIEYSYLLVQFYKLFGIILTMTVPFFLVPRRFFQNLFLLAVVFNMGVMIFGMANYIEVMHGGEFARNYPYLVSNGVTILLQIICLPILVNYLKKMFVMWDGMERAAIWKVIWLLPTLFFAFAMVAQNIFSGVTSSPSYVIIRFLIGCSVIIVCYVLAKSLREESEKAALTEHARVTDRQLAMQREQYERLMENAETVKSMRHDMRHHIAAIGRLAEEENAGKVSGYLEGFAGKLIFAGEKSYCTNYAVDAVAAHYLGLAASEGITVEARLGIPEDTGAVPAMDLCVILGNFLENALEACRRMERGDKFIRIRSRMDGDTLSIVVTNSFDGLWNEKNGAYLSRKEISGDAREGVGLSSVKAVCEKHRGLAQFEITGDIWKSSALVHMGDRGDETRANQPLQ